jgi:DNA-binding XRE family transcriptional regulator
MLEPYEPFNYKNIFAEIDSNLLENRELLLAEIQSGVLEGLYKLAEDVAVKLLKETGHILEETEEAKSIDEALTLQIVESLKASLEGREALSNLANKVSQSIVPRTEPRLQNITSIPSSVVMFSSIAAYTRKDLWKADEKGIAYLEHRAKGDSNNYIEHHITRPGDITLLPWQEAQQIIEKFGLTTAKLHLIFAAHTIRTEIPWASQFSLKASDIVRELGWEKNHKRTIPEKLLEIASTAFALDCLLVKAIWIEGRNRKGQVVASTPIGRVWNVYIQPVGQLNLEGKIDEPDEIYITVQPGLWTQNFLNKAGAKSKEALYQFSYLAQQVLKIDPYHNELALRLAIHLTLDSRVRLDGNYTVRELLEIALPKAVIEEARSNRQQAYQFKKRWDNTLKLLVELDWQVEFDEKTYFQYLQPESTKKKPQGYIDKLLDAHLTIKPPHPIPKLIGRKTKSTVNTKAKAKPKPKAKPKAKSKRSSSAQKSQSVVETEPITGTQIRTARKAKNWSQAKLAGFLDVSQKMISLIERGERSLNPELYWQVRQILEI